jgi:hypothetical protein
MSANNYPQLCREVGLSCQECTEAVAFETARLCSGLRRRAVDQLFVQLYPHPACAPMHAHFEAAYQQAQRKGPARKTISISAAVA